MITFNFVEGASTKPYEHMVESEMDKPLKHFEKELSKINTGRANPALIDHLKVIAYGGPMALRDIAAISAPEIQLLVIQPWDKAIIPDIEKAITASDLGLTPLNDGNLIRIQLPRMTSTRRDEFVKLVHKKLEECKVALRGVRKEFHGLIRDTEKNKKISEDYSKRLQDLLQKITDKFIEQADKISMKKETEIKSL
jgi:ribosome recycling factor